MGVEAVRGTSISEIHGVFDARDAVKLAVYLGNRVYNIREARNNSWEEILSLDERSLMFVGVGKKTLERLDKFRKILGEKAKTSMDMQAHTVKYKIYGKSSYYRRGLYIIDDLPILFPSLFSGQNIILLLRGCSMRVPVDLRETKKDGNINDIGGDIRFLNNYFNLGLELCQVEDSGGIKYVSLKVPQKTEVVA